MLKCHKSRKNYSTSFDYNKFKKTILHAKIKEKLAGQSDVCNLGKPEALATKPELKSEQDKVGKLQVFNLHILAVRVILKMMGLKIIYCFNHSVDALKKLVIAIMFQHGNQKDCLIKVLSLLLYLIIAFL